MRVLKYNLEIGLINHLAITGFQSILKIGEQNNRLFMWGLVDDFSEQTEFLEISVFATGQEIPMYKADELNYIDTVIMVSGFVAHVFEKKSKNIYV